ncbi:hypothetical protein CMTB2_05762 [Caminibacter mediatlanticus TB-2]|uniref:Uncharacterized protein n=1 Tax=Caminibacter mediatlanticus TB-2 TaxID=391592 RepID=A0AAI9AGK0_9BACT|nr:hypothetical protein CMTB2_05762 [Caminibacter mediatlanticus TB-2]
MKEYLDSFLKGTIYEVNEKKLDPIMIAKNIMMNIPH